MSLKVSLCEWADVSFIPEKYDTGYAVFPNRKKEEIWFRAMYGDFLAGVGCLLVMSSDRVRHSNLFVLPEFRKQGVAREIIYARENFARDRGYQWIDVRTVKKYYLDYGYTAIKEYKVGGWWFEKELR